VLNPSPIQDTLVVVVHRNREDFLGAVLRNHVINERRLISVGLGITNGTDEDEPGAPVSLVMETMQR